MRPLEMERFLAFTIANKLPVLIKGKPGIGKSDIVAKASKLAGYKLIISHPVVSDPTDYKGLPFAYVDVNGTRKAVFLPFSDLEELINASGPLLFFIDDLGQAPAAVQAAVMQLILARQINGHKISDHVVFIAATNRKEDKAAVAGLLEPVKSRFASIVELDVNTDDWISWGLDNDMPTQLLAFLRYRPELLDQFTPTKDIVNSPCPRTVAYVGKLQNAGIDQLDSQFLKPGHPPSGLRFEAFKGAVGEAFAIEYINFLKVWADLPNLDQILMTGNGDVPKEPAVKYAIGTALASRINDVNATNAFAYLNKLDKEVATAAVQMAIHKNKAITATRGFIDWSTKHGNFLTGN